MAAGLSLQQVAARLSPARRVSRAALHKYETGASAPAPTMVRELAAIYGVPASRLLQAPQLAIDWHAPRVSRALAGKAIKSLRAQASAQAERVLIVQRLFPEPALKSLPRAIQVRTPAQAEAAAERLRAYWQLGHAPLESLARTIEHHGGVVVALSGTPQGFESMVGVAEQGEAVFVIRADVGAELRRMDLACAVAGCVMLVSPASRARVLEQRFAMALLMPADAARRELGERRRRVAPEEFALLQLRYGLGAPHCVQRAIDLGILPPGARRIPDARVYPASTAAEVPFVREGERPHERLRALLLRALAEGVLGPVEAQSYLPGVVAVSGARKRADGSTPNLAQLPPAERRRVLQRDAQRLAQEHAPGGRLELLEAFEERDEHEGEGED